ncbi:MAG: hypothetical protein JNM78_15715 [Cyclobacteriaceae bacterium]|nr:hypothetical protein [Cyclobacteriaceae bacterium]
MRNLIFYLFGIIMLSCSTRSNENNGEPDSVEASPGNFSLKDLMGEWHMVTQEEGEWVLFYACDADNTTVTIKGDSIVIGWGQDATAGKIESWSVENDKLSLVVNDSYETNVYQVQKAEDGLMQWWLWDDSEGQSLFVHERYKNKYRVVKQPCKECWEDCDEDSDL